MMLKELKLKIGLHSSHTAHKQCILKIDVFDHSVSLSQDLDIFFREGSLDSHLLNALLQKSAHQNVPDLFASTLLGNRKDFFYFKGIHLLLKILKTEH